MKYKYSYQRHPFDDKQYFVITAETQTEADSAAIQHLDMLKATGQTVMTMCYKEGVESSKFVGFELGVWILALMLSLMLLIRACVQ